MVRGVFGSEAGGLVQGGRRGFWEGLREAGEGVGGNGEGAMAGEGGRGNGEGAMAGQGGRKEEGQRQ